MSARVIVILIVFAALVGAAIAYAVMREPDRPRAAPAPAARAGSPNTANDYKRG